MQRLIGEFFGGFDSHQKFVLAVLALFVAAVLFGGYLNDQRSINRNDDQSERIDAIVEDNNLIDRNAAEELEPGA